jgi:hypothetical protein
MVFMMSIGLYRIVPGVILLGLLLDLGAAFIPNASAMAFRPEVAVLMKSYEDAARKADPKFSGFTAVAGKEFFFTERTNGKGEKVSCTTCHTKNLKAAGKTSAGKAIEPMAPSVNPKRLTNPKDIEKWFTRNCKQVVGRECTPVEKGNVLTFLQNE